MSLPSNVFESKHPVLKVKISQLRSKKLSSAREVRTVTNEISQILAVEASATTFNIQDGPKDTSALGHEYTTSEAVPGKYALIPILRSGLSMLEGKSLPPLTR